MESRAHVIGRRRLASLSFLALALCAFASPAQPAGGDDAPERPAIQDLTSEQIESVPDGGTLTLPAGRFRVPAGGLLVDRQITIEGANPGRNRLTSGTILLPADSDPVITLRHDDGNITLRDLIVDAEGIAEHGIAMSTEARPTCVTLERVTVWHATGDGIALAAEDGASINMLVVRDCISNDNGGAGLSIAGAVFPRIEGGYFSINEGGGVRLERCGSARLRDVYFEANAPDPAAAAARGPGAPPIAQLRLGGGHNHVVDGCVFEDFARPGAGLGVLVDGAQGAYVDACMFLNPPGSGAATGVSYRNGSRDNWLGACAWRFVATPWETLQGSAVEATRTQAMEK